MEIYDLNDATGSYLLNGDPYVWVVTDYSNWGYEGDGEAVALRHDGKLDLYNLSHCSCYDPFEDSFDTVTQESFRENAITPIESAQLVEKVLDLLGN